MPVLSGVPFYPDDGLLCGPSALASVLGASGVSVPVDLLVEQIYVPGLEGTLQAEMLAAARRHDRLPVVLDGSEEGLLNALGAGYPVLVLQRLGILWQRGWHYAVLVGYDAERSEYVLHSGVEREKRITRRAFLRTWGDADRWAYAVMDPADLPGFLDAETLLAAAAAAAATGRLEMAATVFSHGKSRWPGRHMFHFGAANVLMRQQRYADAAVGYEDALAVAPGHALSINNLAYAWYRAGCVSRAVGLLSDELERSTMESAERAILTATLSEIEEGGVGAACSLP